jgi:hypothetical protein
VANFVLHHDAPSETASGRLYKTTPGSERGLGGATPRRTGVWRCNPQKKEKRKKKKRLGGWQCERPTVTSFAWKRTLFLPGESSAFTSTIRPSAEHMPCAVLWGWALARRCFALWCGGQLVVDCRRRDGGGAISSAMNVGIRKYEGPTSVAGDLGMTSRRCQRSVQRVGHVGAAVGDGGLQKCHEGRLGVCQGDRIV